MYAGVDDVLNGQTSGKLAIEARDLLKKNGVQLHSPGGNVLIVSDEHITFIPAGPVAVGDFIRVMPAHVDPTVAYHERMHIVQDGEVLETWEVDLRGW